MAEVERTGWRYDDQCDWWVNGRVAITDELICQYPREKIQQFAVEKTGEPLPDEAFPQARGPKFSAEQMELLARALIAIPRRPVP